MNDQVAEMFLESEQETAAELEDRAALLQRVTELAGVVAQLVSKMDELIGLEKIEQGERRYIVTERDEFGRIKTFTVSDADVKR